MFNDNSYRRTLSRKSIGHVTMMIMAAGNARLVYSTETKILTTEEQAEKDRPADLRTRRQKVIVRLDRKGRGGKSVTVVEGLQMPQQDKEALLKKLKTGIGTGGTVKDGALEIQGDHCVTIMAALEKLGHRPKRSGG